MSRFASKTLMTALIVLLATAGAVSGHEHEHDKAAAGHDQEAMMAAWQKAGTPGEQHAMLAKSAGHWTARVKTWMEPGGEPTVEEGTFHRELDLDGRVLQEKFTGSFFGQPFHGRSTTGYDNVTGRWWSTWTDSMSTGLMVMWGEWSDKEKAVVYLGESADPMTGEMVKMKAIVRHPSDGEEVMEMFDLRSGEPVKTMEIHSTRK